MHYCFPDVGMVLKKSLEPVAETGLLLEIGVCPPQQHKTTLLINMGYPWYVAEWPTRNSRAHLRIINNPSSLDYGKNIKYYMDKRFLFIVDKALIP